MKKIILLTFIISSCTITDRNSLKQYIEYKTESQNYLRWSKEQDVNWSYFNGKSDNESIFYNYFGIYFFWSKKEKFKFNVTIYLDRQKSWVKPKSEWGDASEYYDEVPKIFKLKFDYYEYKARELRKFLVENGENMNHEDLGKFVEKYYDEGEAEFKIIYTDLKSDFAPEKFENYRKLIDSKLSSLQQYDTRVNTTIIEE